MTDTVLVTGASRGIGRAIALEAAAAGYPVAVHYGASQDAAEQTLEDIRSAGGEGRLLQFDISDREAARAALEADIADHGAYYGLVLNAGISRDQPLPAMEDEHWDQVLRTNLDGFFNVTRPLIMPMIRRRAPGRIIVLSSISGEIGNRGQTNYAASKAGLIGAAKSLALELAKRNITVNCVTPGLIETDMAADAPVEFIRNAIPLRRLGRPSEVAALVRFLLGSESAYITRQVIRIDGGLAG